MFSGRREHITRFNPNSHRWSCLFFPDCDLSLMIVSLRMPWLHPDACVIIVLCNSFFESSWVHPLQEVLQRRLIYKTAKRELLFQLKGRRGGQPGSSLPPPPPCLQLPEPSRCGCPHCWWRGDHWSPKAVSAEEHGIVYFHLNTSMYWAILSHSTWPFDANESCCPSWRLIKFSTPRLDITRKSVFISTLE